MHDGAVAAYNGYEYQIYATVWLALDLVLSRRWCEALVVEPASQEDVAAELRVPAETAIAKVECRAVQVSPTIVDIQIKHRSQMLSAREFTAIVAGRSAKQGRGVPQRERPVSYLERDEARRFVLLTDGQIHRTASLGRSVGDFGVRFLLLPIEPWAVEDGPQRHLSRRGAPCHPQGRSAAEEAQSALTGPRPGGYTARGEV